MQVPKQNAWRMKLRKNCFKQQILNAMNATLSQNGLGEHRLHEVPPLNTTETSTVIVDYRQTWHTAR